jgi:hypothetical protein
VCVRACVRACVCVRVFDAASGALHHAAISCGGVARNCAGAREHACWLADALTASLAAARSQGTHESLDEALSKETPEQAAARLKQESADTRSAVM